jgi:hypothetical protein
MLPLFLNMVGILLFEMLPEKNGKEVEGMGMEKKITGWKLGGKGWTP